MSELAADGIAVAVSCRVREIARQPHYRWLNNPVTDAQRVEAHRANALFDAHREDPEFGYRYLADEAHVAGEALCRRTAWRICSAGGWRSTISKKGRGRHRKAGPPVHDDLVERDFTAQGPNELWLTDITEHRTSPGQGLPVRDQGRLLGPDRRVFDRLEDEIPPGGQRTDQCSRQTGRRDRLRPTQR